MPRFVLLRHECPPGIGKPSHWDFMLEDGGALLTWSIEELPTVGGAPVTASKLADHRLAYLDYEGPVSGDRGDVRRVDAGEFSWNAREPSLLSLDLCGETLAGRLVVEELPDGAWRLALQHRARMPDSRRESAT